MRTPIIKNPRYGYPGYNRQRAFCDLEVYDLTNDRTLAIVTELDDNSGTSITNRAEVLYTQLMQAFDLADPEKMVEIEHYLADRVLPEHWSRVTCESYNPDLKQYVNPAWEPLTYEEVENLINS
jgi:hypothetical protein